MNRLTACILSVILMPLSCDAAAVWRPIATHVTMLSMVLCINLLFFACLYFITIIKSKRHKDALEYQAREAYFDYLTQVLNRRGFERRMATHRDLRGYILIVDIDDFKLINDRYGHQAGDVVLQEVAKTLSLSLREGDILSRFGGEEFVIHTALTDSQTATELSQRLVDAVSRCAFMYARDKAPISITVSIGVAQVSKTAIEETADPTSPAKLSGILANTYKVADANLYKAKRQGKNQAVMTA